MKILKKVLLALAAFILVILLSAIFIRKEYMVEREITINRSGSEVFNYVKLLKNQEYWSKWAMSDPGMQKSFNGTDGSVGFVYGWNSDVVGEGKQEITALGENEFVESDLHFIRPFEGRASARMETKSISSEQTKVKWRFKSRMEYPLNFMVLFMDMSLGNDLKSGLVNLKSVLEK